VDEGGRLEFRPVDVVRRDAGRVVITAGLVEGDRVVLSPMESPVEGMTVRTAAAEDQPRPSPAGEQP
jgi:multidrug efflux pump subunit AcrA (membrane-fusion protein)